MKRFSIVRIFLLSLALLSIGIFQNSCEVLIEEIERQGPEVTLYPNTAEEIWGYQMLAILFDQTKQDLDIQAITLSFPDGQRQSLISEDNPLYRKPGLFEIEICAECLPYKQVTITIDFQGEFTPLVRTYNINHQPQVNVQGIPTTRDFVLDASNSFDPEGMPLQFSWYWNGQVFHDPILPIDPYMLQEQSLVLSVSDGISTTDDLVSVNDKGEIVYTPDKMKCTSMSISHAGKSKLNAAFSLGAYPAEGTQLPLNADGKLARSFVVAHAFEVVATIVPDLHILDEGQDVARTASFNASDATKKLDKRGSRRKEPNRSEYQAGTKTAGFPDPLPAAGRHPEMVADSYDHHPRPATAHTNTARGMESVAVQSKNLVGGKEMVWMDQPGFRLGSGTDLSNGLYYRAYFRSWMSPDLSKCEKYFIVEIEIDKTGKVVKNRITMR